MNLNTHCPINSTGYGIASLNILKAFDNQGIKFCYFPIGNVSGPKNILPLIEQSHENWDIFDADNPTFKCWHQWDLFDRRGKGLFGALTFFELDEFTKQEVASLSCLDILFVSSHWAKEVAEKQLPNTKIVVAPLGVDRELFKPNPKPKDRPYTFLHCGKWEKRKGADFIVESFNKAFSQEDDVELVMMTYNGFLNEVEQKEWIDLYLQSPLGNKVKILPWLPSQYQVMEVMNYADCGVFPSRAEAWNLELLEMLSVGKPVIATNYSAHTEYCNNENAYLIDIDELEIASDQKWFTKNLGHWAKITKRQIDQLTEHMRTAFKIGKKINSAGLKTAERLTWDNTAAIILNSLQS